MKPLTQSAFPRAGLLGNPSDGYGGKTLSFTFSNFSAEVTLTPSEFLEIEAPSQNSFPSLTAFESYANQHGFYGAERLLKSSIRQFCHYCRKTGQPLHDQNFRVTYQSNIPRQVGLAGSSAIISAMLKALFQWYGTQIPIHLLPALTLQVETAIGIPAGFQDRVIQTYQGLVFMDFQSSAMKSEDELEYGLYQPIEPDRLSGIYIAYNCRSGEPTEVFHNDLARRHRESDPDVISAMEEFANLARLGKSAVLNGDMPLLGTLINRNFDQRNKICRLPSQHVRMVEIAREVGCSAKFCGSGGAIVGAYPDEATYQKLVDAMLQNGCHTLKPEII